MITLAEQLGLTTTAEGIETVPQCEHLRALRCQFAQGYLFARPLDAQAAGDFIAQRSDWRPGVDSTADFLVTIRN